MPLFLCLKTYKGKQNQTFSIYIVMIQWETNSNDDYLAYLSTEDNRINQDATKTQLAYLFKFINDMDGSVQYSYSQTTEIEDRYTEMMFHHHAASGRDMYAGDVHFGGNVGHWKYEVYEVAWSGDGEVRLEEGFAPATELDVLMPTHTNKGIVQGLVTKGILNVYDKSVNPPFPGTAEVQYVQNAKSVQTLTIAYGGAGYTTIPTVVIDAPLFDTDTHVLGYQATATCTISGGAVDTVTLTYGGSGYVKNPKVTVLGGGATANANIIANINETNYIYTG